jgi:hypothetical protein
MTTDERQPVSTGPDIHGAVATADHDLIGNDRSWRA